MRLVLTAVVAGAALFFAVPIVAGGSTDVCQDVALHEVQGTARTGRMSTSSTMYKAMDSAATIDYSSGGSLGGSLGHAAHDKEARLHPHVPPAVACAVVFWKTL
jgi:hypothetical protein